MKWEHYDLSLRSKLLNIHQSFIEIMMDSSLNYGGIGCFISFLIKDGTCLDMLIILT